MPHDPHLAELMREAFAGRPGITEKKMFGGFCWMLNGNMISGVEVGRFMFRPARRWRQKRWRGPAQGRWTLPASR